MVVRHWQSLCCHHHILHGALSLAAISRCLFALASYFFDPSICPTPIWLLLTVSLGRAAARCWRYVNRYHLLSLSCARVFCERSSNRVNFWPASKIKGSIANKKPAECYLLPLSSLSFFLSSSQFCLAGSRQNLSVMLYLPCLFGCVCVFIICGFSLFSHSFFFAGALKFKQSAINYTCWALSRFPAFQLTVFPSLSLGHSKTFAYFRAPASFNTFCGSLSQWQHPLQLRHSSSHAVSLSLRHSLTLSVCQSSLLGSVSVGQKSKHSFASFQGVAPLGFANNFESNFHKLACHTLRALRSSHSLPPHCSACCYNCQLLQL